ncbi:adenine phosphoribosyltransferase [Williamsia sp.]|uniref:adenine phosphoribosyltransferase n=1 Tax=Williamsia sp. TaxID=1872085 RepID=UPI001A1FD15C|nr:adenine phosphoribosyltransferase [Williamsia sp.]MBJ7290475.1 adenine phosphoribosyltransferase [Williamsia sp.]
MTDTQITDAADRARAAIARHTRLVPDFPSPGIAFKDLTPVLADAEGLFAVTTALAQAGGDIDLVAGIDARGFLLGGAIALQLGVGVLAIRKAGKLPPPVRSADYDLEYGTASLEVPADGVDLHGRRVLVVDDVLATGGTLNAAIGLLEAAGAVVPTAVVVMEIDGLPGREAVESAHRDLVLTSLAAG